MLINIVLKNLKLLGGMLITIRMLAINDRIMTNLFYMKTKATTL
jgi:hypothetical protein